MMFPRNSLVMISDLVPLDTRSEFGEHEGMWRMTQTSIFPQFGYLLILCAVFALREVKLAIIKTSSYEFDDYITHPFTALNILSLPQSSHPSSVPSRSSYPSRFAAVPRSSNPLKEQMSFLKSTRGVRNLVLLLPAHDKHEFLSTLTSPVSTDGYFVLVHYSWYLDDGTMFYSSY